MSHWVPDIKLSGTKSFFLQAKCLRHSVGTTERMIKNMEKGKPYQLEKDVVFTTGKSNRVEGDKLKTGEVLRVTHMAGCFENIGLNEEVELGYYNGHAYTVIHRDTPKVAGCPVMWNGNVWLREEQYLYATFVDVADGEKMKLRAEGHWE